MQLSPVQRHPMSSSNLIQEEYVPMSDERPANDRYNRDENERMRTKCKKSLKEAAENIAYNYGKEHPDYLSARNKISEV